jgi:hypothetical protein
MGLHGKGLVQDEVLAGDMKVKLEQVKSSIIEPDETAGLQIDLDRMTGIDNMEWSRDIVEPEILPYGTIRAFNMNR